MNELISSKRLVVFDKDGTLVKGVIGKNGKSHCPDTLETQEYFDDVESKCAELVRGGAILTVSSNQGGVAFSILTSDEADLLVRAATEYIGGLGYRVSFYHPNGKIAPWNQDHRTRKPAPGMLFDLMEQCEFTSANTVMVGDWDTDKQAAEAAGCAFIWANDFFERSNPFADRLHSIMDVK
jgi:D-glycero-D-manno-heptose 1,7-bisphosphate phosphatase